MENEKLTFGKQLFKGAVIANPVLIGLAGICPAAAISVDLFTGLFFSLMFTLITVINCFIASLFLKKVPRTIRVIIYLFVSLGVICPAMKFFAGAGLSETAKLYLPLLAANSVTAVHCEQFAVKNSPGAALKDAISVSIGFSAVMALISAVREILGSGSIAGHGLNMPAPLPGLLMPFGSFILLGFAAMLLKWYISRFRPELYDETAINIKTGKVSFRDSTAPGDEPPAPSQAEFLFGEQAEDELFTEFWLETPSSESIVQNIADAAKENKQYGEQAEERMNELLRKLNADLGLDGDGSPGGDNNDSDNNNNDDDNDPTEGE